MRWRWLGPAIGLAALAVFAYGATLNVESESLLVEVLAVSAFAAPSLAGGYLAWRLPFNPVGWILAAFGLTFSLGVIGETLALTNDPLAPWGAWLGAWQWVPSMALLLVQLPLRFPDGLKPSPRFRWVTPVTAIGVALLVFGNAFRPSITYPTADGDLVVTLPVGLDIPTELFDLSANAGMALMLAAIAGTLVAAVGRFRRSFGEERQQMKVFAYALVVSITGMAANLVLYETGNTLVANAVFAALVMVLVFSIALAVLRYRLYDLDRLISRTASYAIIVGVLAAVYTMGAVWLPTRFANGESPLFVAGSTLLSAALFNPLRRRVMGWVDRRFNRARYDAEQIAEGFSVRLREQVDADRLAGEWADVVSAALEPSKVGVWLRG